MEAIKAAFARCSTEGRAALITYVMAGYPSVDKTLEIVMSMQAGGADIIKLGVPFTDPMLDEPTIQRANAKALENGVRIPAILQMVKSARKQGLNVPVLLVGYYNPVCAYAYGEEKMLRDCQAAGVDGFIILDLPPEEAVRFRNLCTDKGLSYIPVVAPSTPDARVQMLCSTADSFVYIVSQVGINGISDDLHGNLVRLLDGVHTCTGKSIPAAVGFGISTREQFAEASRLAEGVVINSSIVSILENSSSGTGAHNVKEYCLQVAGRTEDQIIIPERKIQVAQLMSPTTIYIGSNDGANDTPEDKNKATSARFGSFSGQYVPEFLIECLAELETGFTAANADPTFWAEIASYASYTNRPSALHLAPRLTEHAGGARIWLKREDLNHTGSHKINNALGQIILARRLGKTSIIAETGTGQHGVATATLCAQFGMKCTIFMGSSDVERQSTDVFQMRILGATVISVDGVAGEKGTLRNAINEAFRTWAADIKETHFVIGSAFGPHPFPTIVRTFQAVIGSETRAEFRAMNADKLPDAVVACVGGGSNAVGMFHAFLEDSAVALVGVEAGGDGHLAGQHSASLGRGSVGVLHGGQSYGLQDENGQSARTHSVSAGLDYPGVGPELASWRESGRAKFISATNTEALGAFSLLSRMEGITPALESAHAIAGAVRVAKDLGPGRDVIVCLSGRGDKDVQTVADTLPTLGEEEV
ncbi:Aldolase-type TIM barrel [Penicillium paradoxum]|uniref:Aldolase-type TIM barrel n=1 Tax=Penicillium paradoxum TaxID=176176 RepID=UPI002548E4A4|nr:Aldolase-type TIM barrel [Penicillium paradoxum]KAJ5779249.1 Aldolase-type TIM barrel [Penicillium paradoxum]